MKISCFFLWKANVIECVRFCRQPPENALQGRVLSEHELRVQRSLQRLNVPDWYKNSTKPADGFLLRRSERRWPGLGAKTTSLSSLGSAPASSTGLRSPTGKKKLAKVRPGRLTRRHLSSNPPQSLVNPAELTRRKWLCCLSKTVCSYCPRKKMVLLRQQN